MAIDWGTQFLVAGTYADHTGMDLIRPGSTGDPILSDGSLLVWDAGYEDKDAALVDGTKLTNLADLECAALTGGTEDDRKPVLTSVSFVPKTTPGTGDGIIEHTAKGAIHVALRQASPADQAHGWLIKLGEEIRQYIKDNPTHHILAGHWSRVTRSPGSGVRFRIASGGPGGVNSNYLVSLLYNGLRTQGAGNHASAIAAPPSDTATGVQRHVMLGEGWTGTPPLSDGSNIALLDTAMRFGVGATLANQGSWADYRLWLEDLTVSGRNPADVAAIDLAMFTKAFGAGGRFADDIWTDPATL